MKNENLLFSFMSTAHGYVAFFCGWRFYEKAVLPSCPIVTEQAGNLVEALPTYLLNGLAFGALFYVATRPLMLLAEHVLDRILCARGNSIGK